MKVTLISKTEKNVEIISSMARATRSSHPATHYLKKWNHPKGYDREGYIQFILDSGHESIVEFAFFTFCASDVSRVLTHQLVRHRIASYLQMSSRHSIISGKGLKLPPEIVDNDKANKIFLETEKYLTKQYDDLIKLGIKKEDARFIFPSGVKTHISIGMNARELYHFLKLRLCYTAQWEIRELAEKMLKILKRNEPCLFLKTEVPCISNAPIDFDISEHKKPNKNLDMRKICKKFYGCKFTKSKQYLIRKKEFDYEIKEFQKEHGKVK